ncbi:uncharacterized protein LOC125648686 isoform X2 [Ostrea edulis]|uniref:uncharacterized protein LOC125648686 isoform X2 n=1 Tax=Ostrea edulis TaxID=37623 RepID=UPI0024AFEA14|nr:uncharacterized protein LOC125648686 isoform X2 [Ostrea edulis]
MISYTMFYLTFVITLCVYLRCTVSENQYVFVDMNKTWTDAIEFCREEGKNFSALDEENIEVVLRECVKNDSVDLWTNTYRHTSPYLSLTGCFEVDDSMDFTTLSSSSVVDCQYHCRNRSTFAVMDNKCACPQDGNSTGARANARMCNITCKEDMYCGGKDYINIYNVVEQTDLDGAMLVEDPHYTTCLTYECLNNTHTLTERNCEDSSITDVACNDYFSCTFEVGDPCFFVRGDFDWKITNVITRGTTITAYEGTRFAHVDDSSYSPGRESYLLSYTDFTVKKWCLRFRYFISSEDPTASMTVSIYDDNSKIVLGSVNYNRNVEWQYTAINIDPEVVFKIMFRTIRATGPSIFAIDDVTLIAGTCEETTTQLLYMKGKLRCNFEDSGDRCFNQSKEDDFDWSIKSGRTPTSDTGPLRSSEGQYYSYIEAKSKRNMTARLVSKFDLQDTNVTFSMQYHMYGSYIGTLTVFLRNRTRGEWNIVRKSGNQGNRWISFEKTFIVEGTWQLCIEAITTNGNRGYIAIDDVKIRINENDFNKTWMNLNERCIRNLGSYPLTKDQVPNTPCLSSDQERWTGIVRPQRNGPTDRVLERSPSAVKVFRFSGNMSIYTWETFDRDTLRPFVCEKLTGNFSDGNYSCSMYSKAKDAHSSQNAEVSGISSEIPVVILAGVSACVLVVLICVVAMVTVYKRKKKAMGTQLMRDENVNTSEDFNSNDISLTESRPSGNNRTQNQTLSEKSPTTDEIYVNQDKTITHPKNIAKEHEDTEEDYDHLHQIRSDVTSTKDDVYSHMTDGLYGSREVKQMVNDEIYDHTMDNEYGVSEVNQGDNETYDHAGFGAPDEVYSLPNKCSELTDNVGLYDSTTRNNNSAL